MDCRLEKLIPAAISLLEEKGIAVNNFIEIAGTYHQEQHLSVVFDFMLSQERIVECFERSLCPCCGDQLNVVYDGNCISLKCTSDSCRFSVK